MKSKQFKLERKIVVLMVFLSAYSICIGADNQTYSSDHLTVINKKRVKKMINKKLMNEFEHLIDVQDRLYSDKERDSNYRKIVMIATILMNDAKVNAIPRSIMFNHKYSLQSLVRSGEVRVS